MPYSWGGAFGLPQAPGFFCAFQRSLPLCPLYLGSENLALYASTGEDLATSFLSALVLFSAEV